MAALVIGPQAEAQPPTGEEYLTISTAVDRASVAPGSDAVIAVILEYAENHHSWPNQPEAPESIPTVIADVSAPTAGVQVLVASTIWPEPHEEDFAGSRVKFYSDRAVALVPVKIDASAAPGPIEVRLVVSYQVCDDKECFFPSSQTVTASLTIDPAAPSEIDRTGHFEAYPLEAPPPAPPPADPTDMFLGFIPVPGGGTIASVLVVILLGALGGFVLNLTPCVLPVIPLKVMALTKHASAPGRTLVLTTWMAIGVVFFWALASIPLMLFQFDPSRVFGVWWVTLGLGLVIATMGIGMLGAFQITLPTALYNVNPKLDTAWGSFVFGIMTAVLGLPCFGFIVGALIPVLAGQPRVLVLLVFASIGVGMAIPYVVLAFFPKLMSKLPKAGESSELIKKVMAMLLIIVSLFFIGTGVSALLKADPVWAASLPVVVKTWHWWAMALLSLATAAWMIYKTFRISKRVSPRAFVLAFGVILAGGTLAIAGHFTNDDIKNFWIPYTPEALAKARSEGKIVVIDFTADWCAICKSQKAAVLQPPPVGLALREKDVIPLIADLTNLKAPGWEKLHELNRTGIPTLAVYRPGSDHPWIGNMLTPDMVLEAMGKTRSPADSNSREPVPGTTVTTSTEDAGAR